MPEAFDSQREEGDRRVLRKTDGGPTEAVWFINSELIIVSRPAGFEPL